MYEDSEDNYIDTSGYQDIESLSESEREELENALYSQIHFEENPNPGCPTFEEICTFQNYVPVELDDSLNLNNGIGDLSPREPVVVNSQYNEHCATDRNKRSESLKESKKSDAKSISVEQEISYGNNSSTSFKKQDVIQNKLSRKHTKRQLTKNGQYKSGHSLSSDEDKEESKYSVRQDDRGNTSSKIDRSKLLNYLKNSNRPLHNKNGRGRGTVKVTSDTDSDEEDSVVIFDSDQSDSDLSNSLSGSESDTDSDSDSDSSSMCEKIFTSDKRKIDASIKLNIGKSCDVDDVIEKGDEFNISSSDSYSSDSPLSDDEDKWQVSVQDLLGSVPQRIRYYDCNTMKNVTCKNCREKGHLSKYCTKPKVIVCYLCGDRNHSKNNCNRLVCSICAQFGHSASQCVENDHNVCSRCYMPGHMTECCPDLWRRYHLTTTRGDLVKPSVIKNSRVSCCNCGSRKHFGFECNQSTMFSHQLWTNPFVMSYDGLPKEGNSRKRKMSRKTYFDEDDDDEIEEKYLPVYKKKKIQLIRGHVPVDPLKNFKNVMKSYKREEEKQWRSERKARRNAKIDKNLDKLLQQQFISLNSISSSFDCGGRKPKGKKYKKDARSRTKVYDRKKGHRKSAGPKNKNSKFVKKGKSIC